MSEIYNDFHYYMNNQNINNLIINIPPEHYDENDGYVEYDEYDENNENNEDDLYDDMPDLISDDDYEKYCCNAKIP